MIDIKAKVEDDTKKIIDAAEKAAYRNFGHAAASISKDTKASLVKADGPSEEGQPPHTHKGAYLRRAVRYAYDQESAIIGPIASIVGGVGEAHEFGGEYKGTDFPERPFQGPALERGAPRFAGDWEGSIGGG